MAAKDYAKARSLLEEAVRLRPDFAEAWVGLGNDCALLKDTTAAIAAYEHALLLHRQRCQMTPSDANQLQQQVYVLLLLGRDAEARDLLSQGMKMHSGNQQLNAFATGLDGILSDKEFLKMRAVK